MTGRFNCSVVVAHGLGLTDGVFPMGFLYFGFGGLVRGLGRGWLGFLLFKNPQLI